MQDALVDVEANLEAVEFEKKRLLAQWRASLAALRVRDDNLQVAAHMTPGCECLMCALSVKSLFALEPRQAYHFRSATV